MTWKERPTDTEQQEYHWLSLFSQSGLGKYWKTKPQQNIAYMMYQLCVCVCVWLNGTNK